jgi:hypothetical protein
VKKGVKWGQRNMVLRKVFRCEKRCEMGTKEKKKMDVKKGAKWGQREKKIT